MSGQSDDDDRQWTIAARDELLSLRERDCGWGYQRATASCVEPTSLAALALRSSAREPAGEAIREAADWLASEQRPDGSLGVSRSQPAPGWMTPYAILVWTAVGVHVDRTRRASDWLLGQKGTTMAPADDPGRIAGHDTTLVGWPWVADTHSWLEPTVLAVLALERSGFENHPRVQEGLRLIVNREVDGGGWNYGNKAVFGRALRPQPAPTGLALLALADGRPRDRAIDRAIEYVRRVLPDVRASASLGWGLVGLDAWGERPREGGRWLSEAFATVSGRRDAAPRLAMLLLASSGTALALFGRRSASGES